MPGTLWPWFTVDIQGHSGKRLPLINHARIGAHQVQIAAAGIGKPGGLRDGNIRFIASRTSVPACNLPIRQIVDQHHVTGSREPVFNRILVIFSKDRVVIDLRTVRALQANADIPRGVHHVVADHPAAMSAFAQAEADAAITVGDCIILN